MHIIPWRVAPATRLRVTGSLGRHLSTYLALLGLALAQREIDQPLMGGIASLHFASGHPLAWRPGGRQRCSMLSTDHLVATVFSFQTYLLLMPV